MIVIVARQNSGQKGKLALISAHSNTLLKFNQIAFRFAFTPKIEGVP